MTHLLTGALLARAAFAQAADRRVLAVAALGALAPDVDVVMTFWDPLAAVKYHRGLTHSLAASLPLALAVTGVTSLVPGGRADWRTTVAALLGVLSHLLLDLLTPFGTRVLLPFDGARYALDLLYGIDPLFTATVLFGLVGARLVGGLRRAALAGILLATLYVGVATEAKTLARGQVEEAVRTRRIPVEAIGVFPRFPGPIRWLAVIQANPAYYETVVALDSSAPLTFRSYPRPAGSPEALTAAVGALEEVRAFQRFARFPWIRWQLHDHEVVAEYEDLRFAAQLFSGGPMRLRVVLDPDGRVKQVSFGHRI